MTWRFRVDHVDEPVQGVKRHSGVAIRKQKPTPFYLTLSPVFIALSTSPDQEGRKLIAHFTRMLGEPTLKYRDRRGAYEDLTAEWHLVEDREAIVQRVMQHLALGFKPEEV